MTETSQTFIRLNKFFNELRFKHCFYNKDCSSAIIKAHSIQNNRILKYIAKEGKVLSFEPSMSGGANLSELGRKKASTFTGFCEKHDQDIFRPIEQSNLYEPGNSEQEFLYAYRALAYSHYGKKFECKVYRKILEMMENQDDGNIAKYLNNHPPFPNGYYDYNIRVFSSKLAGAKDALETYENFRKSTNINLDRQRYFKICTIRSSFNSEFPVAVSSTLFLEYDLENNAINEYTNPMKPLIPSFLTVFPQSGKTYVLFSYFNKHMNFFRKLKNQFVELDLNMKKVVITNLIVNYVENFFVNPDYFSSLDDKMQKEIDELYNYTVSLIEKPMVINSNVNLFYN